MTKRKKKSSKNDEQPEEQQQEQQFTFCVSGQLTPRQKLLSVRLLRTSEPTVVLDEHNAEVRNVKERTKWAVLFFPSSSQHDHSEQRKVLRSLGWPDERVLAEGTDFPVGELPNDRSCNARGD